MTIALFLLNTAMDALMLTLAVRLGGGRIRLHRILLGALAGAGMAMGMGMLTLSRWQSTLMWLPASAIMMRIAWCGGGRRRTIGHALLLLCAAGFVGGMVLALFGATGSLAAAYALGGLAAVCVGMSAARSRHMVQAAMRGSVSCVYRGRHARFDAMIDSGNTLRDYLTQLPVIVLPQRTAQRALRLGDAPLRPIFAETAGGRQRMSVLSPQEIVLDCRGKRRRVLAVLALSPQMSDDVPALVPAVLFDEQGN